MIVYINFGRFQQRYHVFARQNDICRGYLTCAGPYRSPRSNLRRDALTLVPGLLGIQVSKTRSLAHENRKGCLIKGTLTPGHLPETDLFLQALGRASTVEKIEIYVEAARTSPPPSDERYDYRTSLLLTAIGTLKRYCREISASYDKQQPDLISTIWKSTVPRNASAWVVHRMWRARALLFSQVERGESDLNFTPEIMNLIRGRPKSQQLMEDEKEWFSDSPMGSESPYHESPTANAKLRFVYAEVGEKESLLQQNQFYNKVDTPKAALIRIVKSKVPERGSTLLREPERATNHMNKQLRQKLRSLNAINAVAKRKGSRVQDKLANEASIHSSASGANKLQTPTEH